MSRSAATPAVTVTENPTRILASTDERFSNNKTQVTIRNMGTGVVYLGTDAGVDQLSGFPLDVGEIYSFQGMTDIWGVADPGNTEPVRSLVVA